MSPPVTFRRIMVPTDAGTYPAGRRPARTSVA
jgi:hypothetical protein